MFTSFLCGVMAILAGVTDVASIVFHASRPDKPAPGYTYEEWYFVPAEKKVEEEKPVETVDIPMKNWHEVCKEYNGKGKTTKRRMPDT